MGEKISLSLFTNHWNIDTVLMTLTNVKQKPSQNNLLLVKIYSLRREFWVHQKELYLKVGVNFFPLSSYWSTLEEPKGLESINNVSFVQSFPAFKQTVIKIGSSSAWINVNSLVLWEGNNCMRCLLSLQFYPQIT